MKASRILISALVAGLIGTSALPAAATTRIASWNAEHLGWGQDKNYAQMAQVARSFDFISVQEVMTVAGIGKFRAALQALTGVRWKSMVSVAVGRGDYKERYAFLWNPKKVTWIDGAADYIAGRDVFARPPFSARFRTSDGVEFVMATIHQIYGNDVARREHEAEALPAYRAWLKQNFPNTPVLISGDFNLPPWDPAFNALKRVARPSFTSGASTLSEANGRLDHLFDNIWLPKAPPFQVINQGIINYPVSVLGISNVLARETVSDHAPVFIDISRGNNPPAAASAPVTFATPAAVPTNALPPVIGNRHTHIFHLPSCPDYLKVSPGNRAGFQSAAQAIAAGYREARNCQ